MSSQFWDIVARRRITDNAEQRLPNCTFDTQIASSINLSRIRDVFEFEILIYSNLVYD